MKNFFKIFCLLSLIIVFFISSFNSSKSETINENLLRNTENQIIVLTRIEGEIKTGTYQYLSRAFKQAEQINAHYLIIKLDTPGGLVQTTKDIVDLILNATIPVIVFAYQEGGWAYSAGTFILLSADYAIVHPQASIGAAQPREVIVGESQEVDPKIIEGKVSWIKGLAEANQRNSEIAEKFVRENLTLLGTEAKEINVIDETASTLSELFMKLNILNPKVIEVLPNIIDNIFNFLSHPYIISLLLTLGGLALVMAIRTGEFEISGIVGIISLLIGFWGMGMITFSFLGIGLLLLGILLLFLEIFIEPGVGIFGILGGIAIIFGIFIFEAEPFFAPEIFDTITMGVIGAIIFLCLFFVFVSRKAIKIFKVKPKTGSEALIGLQAKVVKELNPRGQVKIKEEIWTAENLNNSIIDQGEIVEIIKVEGNTLFVKKID